MYSNSLYQCCDDLRLQQCYECFAKKVIFYAVLNVPTEFAVFTLAGRCTSICEFSLQLNQVDILFSRQLCNHYSVERSRAYTNHSYYILPGWILKPGVHTYDFAPIHGRRAHIHRSPTENYTSIQKSTYSFPQAICEYARGDRESGQNR